MIDEEILDELTIQDIVKWFDYNYPKDIFISHPIAFMRKMMKWLAGADAMVMIEEEKYEGELKDND